jgi:hypothetical protein
MRWRLAIYLRMKLHLQSTFFMPQLDLVLACTVVSRPNNLDLAECSDEFVIVHVK